MKIQDLEARIAERANVAVQAKIATFKKAIDDALTELFGKSGMGGEQFGQLCYFEGKEDKDYHVGRMRLEGLKLAICDYKTPYDKYRDQKIKLPWPSELWEKERDAIRTELLSKMDLMQQLLISKPRDTADDVLPTE